MEDERYIKQEAMDEVHAGISPPPMEQGKSTVLLLFPS